LELAKLILKFTKKYYLTAIFLSGLMQYGCNVYEKILNIKDSAIRDQSSESEVISSGSADKIFR
jgi:hypothetical protein